jgi:hypothetical protein
MTEAMRLNMGLRAVAMEDAEPDMPWHHKPEATALRGDECPKRAAYVDEVWRRLKKKPDADAADH